MRIWAKKRARRPRRGVLTLEWIILLTVIGIGVITALGLVRNSLIKEFVELTDVICETEVCP